MSIFKKIVCSVFHWPWHVSEISHGHMLYNEYSNVCRVCARSWISKDTIGIG
jgi:hypothetical protein